ncbi:response regulator [Serratia fonticola]|uniref:Response regulator n=1 Tax=Serratia fonticola TaxID=47917 RepID=A0AAJ2DC12_SERFO|nr:response regulator [Serratia fonticola]MDQ9128276.1 response regulator [Serratia fonticola]
MSMTYKILWIEDDEDYVESLDQDIIFRHIGEYGFDVKFEFRTSEEEINMDVDGMQYDLLVIDYNITDDGKNGAEVISSVRGNQCLTDVIFYSGNSISQLRQEALDKELDGVFFSTKVSEPLLVKICQIFDLNVKHLMDIDNVRGLVMSGVADLDIKLLTIIRDFNEKIEETEQLTFRKKIVSNMMPKYRDIRNFYSAENNKEMQELYENVISEFEQLEPNALAELLSNRSFSSFKRVESLSTLCRYKNIQSDYKDLISDIKFLLQWRNALAHQNPVIKDSVKFFHIENEMRPFDKDESKNILHHLRNLNDNLKGFASKIEGF